MSEQEKRPMPLHKISNTLRSGSRLSPALQALVDKSQRHQADSENDDIQQIAVLIKAAQIARQAALGSEIEFEFAVGYVAALITDKRGLDRAKDIAETL